MTVFRAGRVMAAGCFAVSLGTLLTAMATTTAATNPAFLGKPSSSLPRYLSYFPTGGFHHSRVDASARGKAEVIFIGTQWWNDPFSAVECWPVVKALDQFGTLSAVGPLHLQSTTAPPTFDWLRARYRSSYVAFVHLDLLDTNGKLLQRPSGPELSLYTLYARPSRAQPYWKPDPYRAKAAAIGMDSGDHRLPLVAVGGYVQTISRTITIGDFEQVLTPTPVAMGTPTTQPSRIPLPFSAVQTAMIRAKDPPGVTSLVEDVNAEANLIVALVCRADGKRPTSVCGRAEIRTILRGVK